MKYLFLSLLLFLSGAAIAQATYEDSLHAFLTNYVETHEVVKGDDRKALQFYPVNKAYRVVARFTPAADSKWLNFPTSGKLVKVFKVYGVLLFEIAGKPLRLSLYQSQNLMVNDTYTVLK